VCPERRIRPRILTDDDDWLLKLGDGSVAALSGVTALVVAIAVVVAAHDLFALSSGNW
jgi:hypothetical protein